MDAAGGNVSQIASVFSVVAMSNTTHCFFFFQAEDGIRDHCVTGVQTCALPIFGLIKAIDRFDCERGVEFPTFAMPTVVGEIKRFFRDTSWSVRVPRRLQELRLALTKAGDELAQKLDRSPTVPELAVFLGVSEEDVVEGLAGGNACTASWLDSTPGEDEGGEGPLADRLGYEDLALEGVEYRESLKPLLAKLPPRERRIIMLRFFGNLTQSQIGEEVGISQMHVSRLLTRTLAQLRDGLISD